MNINKLLNGMLVAKDEALDVKSVSPFFGEKVTASRRTINQLGQLGKGKRKILANFVSFSFSFSFHLTFFLLRSHTLATKNRCIADHTPAM
jgi:hypothetical protein